MEFVVQGGMALRIFNEPLANWGLLAYTIYTCIYIYIYIWSRVACRYPAPHPPPPHGIPLPPMVKPEILVRVALLSQKCQQSQGWAPRAVQLRGVPNAATLSWTGHGFGPRCAQLLTLNPKPIHIYAPKP